jgi:hypothetical protein
MKHLLTLALILTLAGCNDEKKTKHEGLQYGTLKTFAAAFGSLNPGVSLLDADRSAIQPADVLERSGELRNHWLSQHWKSTLVLEYYDPDNPNHTDPRQDFINSGFPGDCVVIRILQDGQTVVRHDLRAAYGSFRLYGADLDHDGVAEVILEHGWGRGTSANRSILKILKPVDRRLFPIFQTYLTGYLPPVDHGAIPDSWQRRYVFQESANPGCFDVVLSLVPPEHLDTYQSRTENLYTLQFVRQLFRYNASMKTYELSKVVLRPLSGALPTKAE